MLFQRHYHNDLIYLTPIQIASEQLPHDKVRMLYCSSAGKILTAIIENAAYERAKTEADDLRRTKKNYAILDIETAPGTLVPLAIAISPEQSSALNLITEHAIKKGAIPGVLKRYPKEIIGIGRFQCEELKSQQEKARNHISSRKIPEALQRLTYFPGDYMQVVAPLYKAEYRYPLVILKHLAPDKNTPQNVHRFLTVDGEGDLVIIGIQREIIDKAEEILEQWKRVKNSDGCIIIYKDQDGLGISYMEISALQRNALESVVQKFEESRYLQDSIASDAITVISRATNYFQ
jgi:hypothetical protein